MPQFKLRIEMVEEMSLGLSVVVLVFCFESKTCRLRDVVDDFEPGCIRKC